jgi:hypothetical protein
MEEGKKGSTDPTVLEGKENYWKETGNEGCFLFGKAPSFLTKEHTSVCD